MQDCLRKWILMIQYLMQHPRRLQKWHAVRQNLWGPPECGRNQNIDHVEVYRLTKKGALRLLIDFRLQNMI
jgi:hypothetical protein